MTKLIDRLVAHYRSRGPVVLLESQLRGHPASRCSYLAAKPAAIVKARGCRIEIFENGDTYSLQENPWHVLARCQRKWGNYLFGYLGYDLKNHIENLSSENRDEIEAPDLFFMVPSVLLKIDRETEIVEEMRGSLPTPENLAIPSDQIAVEGLQSSITKEQYFSGIEQIRDAIYEGEYYELNFTHQLQSKFSGSSFALYQKMRQAGPVPFAAYAAFDDIAVCCLSPERFIRKQGKTVISQPIKGTIKRDADETKDVALKKTLLNSTKNRAENMMIVDLVRNDLSRIARQGSVKVSKLFEIQSFATVHQMISTIQATTAADDPIAIIKACFPMGSMTGAPKISVMKAIEKLENYRRGIYSGAIGYVTPTGDFDFNVVIRTAIARQDTLFYSVGGAITADSDAEQEWKETWLKARALTEAVK